ncbi:MAG TPA: hydroxyethylthiazole kinase, partial [Mobilitalea sp.]|nr:hydroxyethylthiazole kinase [Mobilitalea sp.]
MFDRIIEKIREKSPLVHCITNYVTVNDCANILLACGASPIMADDRLEVEEITSISNALVINIGTLNERTVDSMLAAGRKANELNHPVILDPVGAGASRLRTDTVKRLLSEVKFSVIRGNISEIKAVYNGSG